MKYLAIVFALLIPACASQPGPDVGRQMEYHTGGYDISDTAAEQTAQMNERIDAATSLIRERRPSGTPVTLIYVDNTINLVDTPTSFTRDMGGFEAPTARISAVRQFTGSALRVIDPSFPAADMLLDCQNAGSGARVFLLRTYVSNYDKDVKRHNKGFSPYAEQDDYGVDLSKGNGSSIDTFTIESELIDCFGNVIRSLSPTVSVSSSNKDQSVFLFTEIAGVYFNDMTYYSKSLNSAKQRAIELVVADMGMFIAGVPDATIQAVISPQPTAEQPTLAP